MKTITRGLIALVVALGIVLGIGLPAQAATQVAASAPASVSVEQSITAITSTYLAVVIDADRATTKAAEAKTVGGIVDGRILKTGCGWVDVYNWSCFNTGLSSPTNCSWYKREWRCSAWR